MKAAVIYAPGGPAQLKVVEYPMPVATAGNVLVKIRAFGLNRSELMTRKGYSPGVQFPRILGIECTGEVVTDPSGKLQPGQQVAAFMGGMGRDFDGGYAEYATLPASILYPFSSRLPWEILGALPEMFQTVYGALYLALNITRGETLLIRGGTSSIGLLAIQLAWRDGLKVIATTRDRAKVDFLLEQGCDEVLIDDGQLPPQIADKVLELVGTNTLRNSLLCARPGGTVCMTGILSETWTLPEFTPMGFIPSGVKLTVSSSSTLVSDHATFATFIKDVEDGHIRINTGKVFDLDDIVAAHELMDSNQANGKIVVIPS